MMRAQRAISEGALSASSLVRRLRWRRLSVPLVLRLSYIARVRGAVPSPPLGAIGPPRLAGCDREHPHADHAKAEPHPTEPERVDPTGAPRQAESKAKEPESALQIPRPRVPPSTIC